MVILVMFVLVGALTAGFSMMSGERATDDATLQGEASTALAESALQQALRNRASIGLSATPGAAAESVRVTFTGGYADVIQQQLRPQLTDVQTGVYLIRVRGVRTRTGVYGAGNSVSNATMISTFKRVSMRAQSAMTGINGIQKAGSSGLISGTDVCGATAGLPAVAVPTDPGITGTGQWMNSLVGTPKISTIGADADAAAAAVPIDWDAIVNGGAITPDFDVPTVAFPADAWFTANPNRWPTIIVRNGPNPSTEYTLPNFGRGLLMIFGDVRLNGNTAGWNGLILVGGRLRSNGSNEISGGVVSGLNVKLGFAVDDNDVNELNGTKKFLYNSCNISSAINGGGGASMRGYQNTWSNTFSTY